MRLRAYAFVRGTVSEYFLGGVRDAPVRLILAPSIARSDRRPVGLLASDAEADQSFQPSDAESHDHVVRDAVERFDSVVPVRFGCLLEARDVPNFLARNLDLVETELDRLEGMVEFALRLVRRRSALPAPPIVELDDEDDRESSGIGERYLKRKLALDEIAELRRQASKLKGRFSALAREIEESSRRPDGFVEVALTFLVPAGSTESFRGALEEVAAHRRLVSGGDHGEPGTFVRGAAAGAAQTAVAGGTAVLWSGPWPPYSFVRLRLFREQSAEKPVASQRERNGEPDGTEGEPHRSRPGQR